MSAGKRVLSANVPAAATNPIICFAEGTLIHTPYGDRRIEHLAEGDLVLTLDRGPQPVRWMGSKTVAATGAQAPVRFLRGAIGNDRDLLVSPHHRMLVPRHWSPTAANASEFFAPALAMVDNFRVSVAYGGLVTYHHMMFDRHEVVIANGAASESFHPGGFGLDALEAFARDRLFERFPRLRTDLASYGDASRPCLCIEEARRLAVG